MATRTMVEIMNVWGDKYEYDVLFSYCYRGNNYAIMVNALTSIGSIDGGSTLMFKGEDGAVLDFSGNPVTNVNIAYSGKFRCLALFDCEIEDYSFLYATTGSQLILEYNAAIDFSSLATTAYYQYSLIDCPLDQQINVRELLGSYSTEFVDKDNLTYNIDAYLPDTGMKGVPEYYR